jgi:tRNA-splicing ligase RtcB
MREIKTERLPIWLWADYMEDGAQKQAINLALHPYTFHHIAIMPDNHQGYGVPIGGVAATKGVVIPEAVGVDIGCGMRVVKTSLTHMSLGKLQTIVDEIKLNIPVGFSHRQESLQKYMPMSSVSKTLEIIYKEYDSACHQIGTLGGGNHFIEIQKGDDGYIWVMVHSGSRNLGKKVAEHHIKIATEQTEKSDVNIPKSWELDYLYFNTVEGKAYINEMRYCMNFAKINRAYMTDEIRKIILYEYPETRFFAGYDVHHNYAEIETHYDQNVMVHRKGATSARKGEIGIIPGSQGTASYIVEGRGNMKSFMSCSHGSGRVMGRGVAKRTLNFEEQKALLDNQGIIHDMISIDSLDEAPGAYKQIEEVMRQQLDLVKPIVRLTPLAVIKG